MKVKFKTLLQLFIDYFIIGITTFGGGYAMIPLIKNKFVEKRKTITEDEILEIVAISESTPGPFAINSATFIGYKVAGVLGSIFATIGVVLPSFLIIFTIASFYKYFEKIEVVVSILNGIVMGAIFLIFNAAISLYKKQDKDWKFFVLFLLSFVSLLCIKIFSLHFSTIYIILSGALISFIFYLFSLKKAKKEEDKNV